MGALIAAASNVGRKSSTSTSLRSTKASSAATVIPASRAGRTSQPAGHGVTPAMFLNGDFLTAMGSRLLDRAGRRWVVRRWVVRRSAADQPAGGGGGGGGEPLGAPLV